MHFTIERGTDIDTALEMIKQFINIQKEAGYNLNSLESCKGYTIKVCYLNRFGELHRCDCTKENKLHTDGPRVVIKEVVKPVVKKEPYSWITKAIVPSATLLIGVVIGRRLKISL